MGSKDSVRNVLMISGGKDSTALALYMREHYPDIEMEYVFCDTHKELEETYEYLTKIEAFLGKPVTRLSSGAGERGFDHWLDVYGGYLPSPSMRWCTKKLKLEPFEKHVGDDPVRLYVAIRADEHREGYISTKPNIEPIFPFKEEDITKEDVFNILEDSGVGLPEYYEWRTRSGCYFCFFQRRNEWVGLKERHPELYEKAKEYEKTEEGFTWIQGESLDDLEDPGRMQKIKDDEAKRQQRVALTRKPKTLAEAFGEISEDPDDGDGCLICQL